MLNGNLGAKQNITHVSRLTKNNTFATYKEVHLHVNLTDLFQQQPSLTYVWIIDNVTLEGENNPDLTHNFTRVGKHTVSVVSMVTQAGFQDCEGANYTQNLNGSFTTELILKGNTFVGI